MNDIKVFGQGELKRKLAVVVGTRPGIVMFGPILQCLRREGVPHFVIHTGQHYSPNMDSQLFKDLGLHEPDYKLYDTKNKKTHGAQTAFMLEGVEKILMHERPRVLLVGGDANTNLAGALAARKLRIQVGHVEAGERSFDWRMPEEHNRVIIDHISDHLFVTNEKGKQNLLAERVRGHIHVTGNPIVDASLIHFQIAQEKSNVLHLLNLQSRAYGIMTMHREENVDFEDNLREALEGVAKSAEILKIPIVFVAHPRTLKRLQEFNLMSTVRHLPRIQLQEAVGYLDFLHLLGNCRIVFTDSGGVQQEACIHGIPCITLRDNTEWIETLEVGANRLAGCDSGRIVMATSEALATDQKWEIPFGDGNSAQKIVAIVKQALDE